MIASTPAVDCSVNVLRVRGRLIVCCEVKGFVVSGLTADELFVILQPQLVASTRDAAKTDPNPGADRRPTSVQMDEGGVDPEISIFIHSPAAILEKLNEHFAWVQSTVERFVAGHHLHRSKVEMGGGSARGDDLSAAGEAPQ